MFHDILLQLGDFAGKLFHWYTNKVIESWRQAIRKSQNKRDGWIGIALCIFFSLFLLCYLPTMAFSESLLFGLSFIWSAFLAISFAYVLRHPVVLICVYIGAALGQEANNLFVTATKEAASGSIIGAIILLSFSGYLIFWANRMKKGEI
jgi:cobalamin biosynthesis protein CobD/CbiB